MDNKKSMFINILKQQKTKLEFLLNITTGEYNFYDEICVILRKLYYKKIKNAFLYKVCEFFNIDINCYYSITYSKISKALREVLYKKLEPYENIINEEKNKHEDLEIIRDTLSKELKKKSNVRKKEINRRYNDIIDKLKISEKKLKDANEEIFKITHDPDSWAFIINDNYSWFESKDKSELLNIFEVINKDLLLAEGSFYSYEEIFKNIANKIGAHIELNYLSINVLYRYKINKLGMKPLPIKENEMFGKLEDGWVILAHKIIHSIAEKTIILLDKILNFIEKGENQEPFIIKKK